MKMLQTVWKVETDVMDDRFTIINLPMETRRQGMVALFTEDQAEEIEERFGGVVSEKMSNDTHIYVVDPDDNGTCIAELRCVSHDNLCPIHEA